ncbi:hypothetical protein [Enterococcus casseliflavus]|uniref:hypothetical protein n=1 Tax=Enterococcus casseliflavus TaxID=37734 RepID=UPI0039A4999D
MFVNYVSKYLAVTCIICQLVAINRALGLLSVDVIYQKAIFRIENPNKYEINNNKFKHIG